MRTEYLLLRQTELNCMVHINPELEVLYVEKGTVFVKDELQTFPVSQGEASLILPYHLHGFSCDEAYTKATVFMFSYSIAEDFYNAYKMQFFQSKKFKINSSLSAFVAYSLGQFLEKEEGCTIKSIFYAMASSYLRQCQPSGEKKHLTIPIQEALEYVFFHLDEDLTLQTTATALGINKKTLGNTFRNILGISFGEFVTNVRIERAKSLLEKSDMNITEIAYECGFGCIRSFNRAFLKCLKCTPTEYRKA